MASRFQEASLVTSPSYPNAVAWSSENLIAVAAGHLVIILNPALPGGPRGLISIPNPRPYQIGLVRSQDLLTGGLLPSSLKRERHPCVRSLSWSDLGMSQNYGCLLAVCTAEGRVKLYRPPFSDFCSEWIEIVDVSDLLYENLLSMNFGESSNPSTSLSKDQVVEHDLKEDERNPILKACKRRRTSIDYTNLHEMGTTERASCSKQDIQTVLEIEVYEPPSNAHHCHSLPKAPKMFSVEISSDTYVSREALLSTLSVAWSCLLSFSSEGSSCEDMLRYSLLAIGSKSGCVSIWKVHAPECYHIERGNVSPNVELTSIIQAHSSWVSTMSWGVFGCASSNPQVVLVTGSCDGSVKIWMSNKEDLQKSVEVYKSSFSLLKQVVTVNLVPVSTLSFVVNNYSNAMHLAIGKASGSFEVWKCEISTGKFEQVASTNAHDQVVTGLAWSYDCRCLCSCSLDNYVRNWILSENTICEVPIPADTPGLSSTNDLPDDFLSCLGVALSPGNLAVALVRSFNVELLNPMYQARSQKAAVEFLWNGAQQSVELDDSSETVTEAILGFSKNEFAYWESNLLWSLKEFKDYNKPLVLWDVIASMLAFKQSVPEFVELVITKWLSVAYLGFHADIPMEDLVPKISKRFSAVPSRLLHILNVISRRVMLSELKTEEINRKLQVQRTNNEEEIDLWLKLLQESERELRERLVGLSFSAYLTAESSQGTDSSSAGNWRPAGLAQMQQWVEINHDIVLSQLQTLSLEVKSSLTAFEEENCPYCAAPVHFHSPEEACCQSPHQNKKKERCDQGHKLERCSVSMQVCPPTPLWFCKCCNRLTLELAPEILFALPSFPSDLKSLSFSKVALKPFCLFCGILLQRKQPDFLLSASPVALSWFAVGCYYYCIKKYAEARRYFSKATNIDGSFSPAWIGFGNSFAAQEEGDQAMSAYRTAARLFPGCHLPTLYIGMEYMRTHSYKLADQFFMQAKAICPSDPLVYNELGVVAYHMKEYGKAVRWFEKTLAHIPSTLTEIWEPTVVNLAHAYRKLRKHREAISYYERALTLSTKSLSTYSGLAYTYHLQGNFSAAISYYHKALWLKPDDQFCTEMLNVALMDECQNGVDSKVELC